MKRDNLARRMTVARRDLAILLFLTLLGSYAYFWQPRDWNVASRLMLTYALADRHQVKIDGLEGQAGQRARFSQSMVAGDLAHANGHFYSDKAPGQSLLGFLIYAPVKFLCGLPDHPLYEEEARAYWAPDYWITLGTSGVLTAALGVVTYAFSVRLGATHLAGLLLGLAYGLSTPAFVYATLFYGHQAGAFCTMTSFFLLYRAAHEGRASGWTMFLSGLLAGYAIVVEYPTLVISAILAFYAVAAIRRVRPVVAFLTGAVLAASLLAIYNYRAFGNPFDFGYAHEVDPTFRAIHSRDNRLGLQLPDWSTVITTLKMILWGRYRGLMFYAPILLAAPFGLVVLVARKYWDAALVAVAAFGSMLAVNLSYPMPQGGWGTGPRLLLPAVPFATIAVAGLLGAGRRGVFTALVASAAVWGGIVMLGCVAVGGRFPDRFADPVRQVVLPHWSGQTVLGDSTIAGGRQFVWNVGRWVMEHCLPRTWVRREPSAWQDLQMAPLVLCWIGVGWVLLRRTGKPEIAAR